MVLPLGGARWNRPEPWTVHVNRPEPRTVPWIAGAEMCAAPPDPGGSLIGWGTQGSM